MTVGAIRDASPVLTLDAQPITLEDAQRILTDLLGSDPGQLKNPLDKAQRTKYERDLGNIHVLWKSGSGRLVILLDIRYARMQGIL